ncbi:hypothetical protein WB334_14975 [Escherichia coli]|uniref:hypothetical protein n=1 Tax=Escherichia coli TaxID=562 RepID=UPI000AF8BF57|nr:hypothetical protein [Escherichia coli]EHX5988436.1 hypothetical protein [Escherichia coli]EIW8278909.1 hypothetical protein [Escherichia coli]EJJ9406439.1 hypothetical protein [Escherichia coli]EKY5064670.1 hypothetical protein [Escherichia coli]MBB6951673.1 hypothetical protein [Escherichia coli]
MAHTQSEKKTTQLSTAEVFARMGVAMEELLQASPQMWQEGKFDGHEMHGELKDKQKAA